MSFKFSIKPRTLSNMARNYGVSRPTMRKRFRVAGIVQRVGNFFSAAQIALFVQFHGWPKNPPGLGRVGL